MAPSECDCLGFTIIPSFWWQLVAVSVLTALTLLCGWLQGIMNWQPADIDLEPSVDPHGSTAHH
jgi:hypothetical protein